MLAADADGARRLTPDCAARKTTSTVIEAARPISEAARTVNAAPSTVGEAARTVSEAMIS